MVCILQLRILWLILSYSIFYSSLLIYYLYFYISTYDRSTQSTFLNIHEIGKIQGLFITNWSFPYQSLKRSLVSSRIHPNCHNEPLRIQVGFAQRVVLTCIQTISLQNHSDYIICPYLCTYRTFIERQNCFDLYKQSQSWPKTMCSSSQVPT